MTSIGARTLFATHYHELVELARTHARVRNLSMGVREAGGKVVFLRTVVEGGASKSYGIEVARLAGLPGSVLRRAREVLRRLETEGAPRPGVVRVDAGQLPLRLEDGGPPTLLPDDVTPDGPSVESEVLAALRDAAAGRDDAAAGAAAPGAAPARPHARPLTPVPGSQPGDFRTSPSSGAATSTRDGRRAPRGSRPKICRADPAGFTWL